jgi:hypothetical protein
MRTCLVLFAAACVLIATAPPLDADDGPKPEAAGYLMPDTTCPAATYVLLSPCPPNPVGAYVSFPQGRNIERFVGRLVAVRGEIDPAAPCPKPLIKATRVGETTILPPCPPPECEFPPCP